MQRMANKEKQPSVWDVFNLLKQVPIAVYIFPLLAAFVLYVLLGTTAWLVVTPFWKELAGEWDVVGKFVAVIAWVITFPIVFNLMLCVVVGIAFDPLASAIDQLLYKSEQNHIPIGQQWNDGFLRLLGLSTLQLVAFCVGLTSPLLGLILSGATSVVTALVLITTPACTNRGVRLKAQLVLLMRKLRAREILLGILAAIMLNNPVLQVITLVPLIVIGQLLTRSWLAD